MQPLPIRAWRGVTMRIANFILEATGSLMTVRRCAVRGAVAAYLAMLSMLAPNSAGAQTASISGTVLEVGTRQPIEGASVVIEGTTLGTRTRSNGTYTILGVPPGTHTLTARRLGYGQQQVTNVVVGASQTRRVDFDLDPRNTLGTVRVEISQPIVDIRAVSSELVLSAQQIMSFPFSSISEVLAMSPGFSILGPSASLRSLAEDRRGEPGQISVRGGRPGATVQMIDGVVINSPVFGSSAFDLNPMTIGSLGFSPGYMEAQYGSGVSGIVNTVLREGGERFEQLIDYQTTSVPGFLGSSADAASGTHLLRGRVSGPIGRSKALRFSVAGQFHAANENVVQFPSTGTSTGGRGPTFTGWHGLGGIEESQVVGKLTFAPNPELKLTLSGVTQTRNVLPYDRKFLATYAFNAEPPTGTIATSPEQLLVQGSVHRAARFLGGRVEKRLDRFLISAGAAIVDAERETCNRFLGVCIENRFWRPGQRTNGTLVPVVNREVPVTGTSTAFGGEDYTSRYMHADVTWQPDDHNRLQAGARYTAHDITFREVLGLDGGLGSVSTATDLYRAKPIETAAYLQDVIEYDFLYVTAGIRVDHGSARGIGLANPLDASNGTTAEQVCDGEAPGINETPFTYNNLTGFLACKVSPLNAAGVPVLVDSATRLSQRDDFQQSTASTTFSPRLGLSFPLGERSAVFMNVGSYVKYPFYHDAFRNMGTGSRAGIGQGSDNVCADRQAKPGTDECNPTLLFHPDLAEPVGNPNLRNERSKTFEIGYVGRVKNDYALGVTAYSTDQGSLTSLANSREYRDEALTYTPEPEVAYSTLVNGDQLTTRGVSLSFRRQLADHWGFTLNYTWSRTTEIGQPPELAAEANLDTEVLQDSRREERISARNRPHAVNAAVFVDFRREVPGFPLSSLMRNTRAVLTYSWTSESGFRLTTTEGSGAGQPSAVSTLLAGATNNPLSLMMTKDFMVANARYGLFLRITNLLNDQNEGAPLTIEERRLIASGLPVTAPEERMQGRRFFAGFNIEY
jgi:outer membrane receptor for ferrienterochelin and colicin